MRTFILAFLAYQFEEEKFVRTGLHRRYLEGCANSEPTSCLSAAVFSVTKFIMEEVGGFPLQVLLDDDEAVTEEGRDGIVDQQRDEELLQVVLDELPSFQLNISFVHSIALLQEYPGETGDTALHRAIRSESLREIETHLRRDQGSSYSMMK